MKKLYTIILFVLLINITEKSFSQVIYTDLRPDTVMEYPDPDSFGFRNEYNFDIDADLINDVVFFLGLDNPIDLDKWSSIRGPYWGTVIPNPSAYFATILSFGDSINESSICSDTNITIQIYEAYSPWTTANNKFIGFRKKIDSDYFYGWIRLKNHYTVSDFCIHSLPNISIRAGEGLPLIAEQISLEDSTNYIDGRDLSIQFQKPISEISLLSYRICVVKTEDCNSFTLDSANALPDSCYTEILTTDSSYYSFTLDSAAKDVNGVLITELVPYRVFILSVVDGFNLTENYLSYPSEEIVLSSPCSTANNVQAMASYLGVTNYNIAYGFSKADSEEGIAEYRAFFILENEIDSFSVEDAYLSSEDSFISFIPTGSNFIGFLSSDTVKDFHGNFLKHEQDYKLRILSVADGIFYNTHTHFPTVRKYSI